MLAHLLFTNHDFGHSFEGQEMNLIALVVEKKLVQVADFELATIGQGATERSDSSRVPTLYGRFRYHYVLDARTHSIISTLNQSFYIASQIAKENEEAV